MTLYPLGMVINNGPSNRRIKFASSIEEDIPLIINGNEITNALTITPTGVAGGDLSDNYPNPNVIAIHSGVTKLTISTITNGHSLTRSGTSIIGQLLNLTTVLAKGTTTAGYNINLTSNSNLTLDDGSKIIANEDLYIETNNTSGLTKSTIELKSNKSTIGIHTPSVTINSTSLELYTGQSNNTGGSISIYTSLATAQSGAISLETGNSNGPTGQVSLTTGDSLLGISGSLALNTGTAGTGSGDLTLYTGIANTTSGFIKLRTGNSTTIDSGELEIRTGSGNTKSGTIEVLTGSAGTSSGAIYIRTGVADEHSGNIYIATSNGGSDIIGAGDINISTGDGISGNAGSIIMTLGEKGARSIGRVCVLNQIAPFAADIIETLSYGEIGSLAY
jgi:hypothetical protein